MPKCRMEDCGYEGTADEFGEAARRAVTLYHDVRCPRCGTTKVDTSDIARAWAERGEVYGYGNNNSLNLKEG